MSLKLRYLYRAYRYRLKVDAAELRFICRTLRPGQVAVDIGCHKGAYTYWMRRSVGPSGAVYCFEPQSKQVAYLHEVFSAMSYDNVSLVPMAVSDQVGKLPLIIPTGAGETHYAKLSGEPEASAPGATELVDVTTLDTFFADKPRGPNLLKIDVEGHELSVLHGAKNTLQKHHPAILVECEARHRPDGQVRPVFDFLTSLGYTGSFFHRGTRRPLSEFNPAVHQALDPTTPDRLPRDYVNNFAFT